VPDALHRHAVVLACAAHPQREFAMSPGSPARAFLIGAAALLFAVASGSALARQHSHKHATGDAGSPDGSYDYYVMALSWSPTFCQTHPDEEEQCGH
jgi:ribonuclease I